MEESSFDLADQMQGILTQIETLETENGKLSNKVKNLEKNQSTKDEKSFDDSPLKSENEALKRDVTKLKENILLKNEQIARLDNNNAKLKD
jgi:predicted  nucleic acid-binding Zn-ribbon protein